MASCNLEYSGRTGAIKATAEVYEQTTSGTTRRVQLIIRVRSNDGYNSRRDAAYEVSCPQSYTEESVGFYQGFYIEGDSHRIYDETFDVSVSKGSSTAYIDLSFTVRMKSSSAGEVSISGTVTKLYLTAEPAHTASTVTAGNGQMGKKIAISINSAGGGYSHNLEYRVGSDSPVSIAQNVDRSYAWTVPDLAAKCSGKTELVCEIICKTYNGGSFVGSHSCTVTLQVPDATTPTVPDGVLGSQMTIALPRGSGNFTHQLVCTFHGAEVTIASSAGASQNWTPGYDLAKQIPNLTYGTATLRCTTKNGSAVVGTAERTFRLTVPENDTTRPKIEKVELSNVSSLSGDLAELYIRGRTGLKATISASSTYSTIQSYRVAAGDVHGDGNPAVIELLVNDGQVQVVTTVTDARGFQRSHSQSIQVLSYSRPKIVPYKGYADIVCERALSSGELSNDGTYLAIKAGKSFSSFLVNGQERNACALRYRFKVSANPDFGPWEVLLGEGSQETEIQVLIGNIVSSTSRSYDIELSAVDALGGEHRLRFPIMTSSISFVLYDGVDGAGFGKYPEEPHVVDIASHMTLKVRGKLEVLGAVWESLGLQEAVAESPYPYGRKEDTGCHYQISNGNHVHVAFNCSFTYRETAIAVNKTPIPEDSRPQRPVCSLCAANDRQVVLVCVRPDGYVWVEYVAGFSPAEGAPVVLWVDGYLDYWI